MVDRSLLRWAEIAIQESQSLVNEWHDQPNGRNSDGVSASTRLIRHSRFGKPPSFLCSQLGPTTTQFAELGDFCLISYCANGMSTAVQLSSQTRLGLLICLLTCCWRPRLRSSQIANGQSMDAWPGRPGWPPLTFSVALSIPLNWVDTRSDDTTLRSGSDERNRSVDLDQDVDRAVAQTARITCSLHPTRRPRRSGMPNSTRRSYWFPADGP